MLTHRAIIGIGLVTSILAPAAAIGQSAGEASTLRDVCRDHFLIGTALNRGTVAGSGFRRSREQAREDLALVKAQFNQVSPENALKWERIHPQEGPDGYRWAAADAFVDFGVSNGMYVVGHTLVWHSQTPSWVFRGNPAVTGGATGAVPSSAGLDPSEGGANARDAGGSRRGRFGGPRFEGPPASREELLARMREHIHAVVGRYRGRIQAWDVVNEALTDGGDDILRNSPWLQIIGPDYIAKAFEFAHEADPNAILRYNDYGLESPAKRRKLLTLIRSLQDQGVPVMAIGTQAHLNLSDAGFESMDQALTEMATLGLPIHVTELDINTARGGQRSTGADIADNAAATEGGREDEAERRLAAAYAGVFRAFLKHRASVEVVTFWGPNDALSWRRQGTPLLFDGDNRPKPAYNAVIRVVTEAPEPPVPN